MKPNDMLNDAQQSNTGKKSVCILGGGISGLSLAYFLLENNSYDVTIYEKEGELGGNCVTLDVDLGNSAAPPNSGPPNTVPHIRWADMGVNDYNKTSYPLLNELMKATGYNEGNPLEDTEAYGNSNGTVCYTNDGAYNTPMPQTIYDDNQRFQTEAPVDYLKNPKYYYYTLHDYVIEKKYSEDFIYNNLYPRVNGMYFCGGAPGEMSFRGVMSYYCLQEGYGSGKADRRYFKGGTREWIASLETAINKRAGKNVFVKNTSPEVTWKDGAQTVVTVNGVSTAYDIIVLAMKADDAIKCFKGGSLQMPKDVLDILVQFQYVTDESIVHTDARTLHPRLDSWRTYNIHVYDSKNFFYGPYTITYVANRHQNDCQNPAYAHLCENPQFLISVNPVVEPAMGSILKQTNGQPAKKTFRHQKLNINSINAQDNLQLLQGKYNLWYANGYVYGAGLHEECIQNARYLADRITGRNSNVQYHFDPSPDAKQYAPDFILNAINKE